VVEARGISYQKARALDLRAEFENAAETVARIAPRTAYLGIREMSRPALESLELSVHRLAETHDRMILDLRDNSGGREADRMLSIFTQTPHAYTIPRGGKKGYPIDRLRSPAWKKPLVVLCNEISYSNSEIFCHAVKHLRRAPLVGTRTAGGVISAVNVTIPDVGVLQVPFRSWFLTETGDNLDLNGAVPDNPVDLGPAEEDGGHDPQLQRAIEVVGKIR
jgi:tricorn protease